MLLLYASSTISPRAAHNPNRFATGLDLLNNLK
jgi:hypothetical protein